MQPFTRLTLKDSETLPLLSQPLYGGLMIYCSDFSLFSSYLEGGQFNKHARFLPPGLQIVLSRREMCHGATVCSTAVTQFRDFFTRSASEGAEKSSEKPETCRAAASLLLFMKDSHADNSRRQNNVNRRGSREVACPVCDLIAPYCTLQHDSETSCFRFLQTSGEGVDGNLLTCYPAAGSIFKTTPEARTDVSQRRVINMFARSDKNI